MLLLLMERTLSERKVAEDAAMLRIASMIKKKKEMKKLLIWLVEAQ